MSSFDEIRAARGGEMSCKGWPQEAALLLLMNSLDEEITGHPEGLMARTRGTVRSWESYLAMVRAIRELGDEETLLVNDGKLAGVFLTHRQAPRVLIAHAGAPDSNGEENHETAFGADESDRIGLIAHGQIAAQSWMDSGGQEILLGAYTTFAAASRQHFHGDLSGKLVVSGGFGRMGGAQSLAATLNGAAFLGIDVDALRIKQRIRAGGCDYCVNDLDEALRILKIAVRQKQPISVGLIGNCADVVPEMARRGVVPDLLTDQTSANDPLNGYIPSGLSLEQAARLRSSAPGDYLRRSYESISLHAAGMKSLENLGAVVFEYGNGIGALARKHGGVNADFPGFADAYLRPVIRAGLRPLRWFALSGNPADIYRVDSLALETFPDDASLSRWIQSARRPVKFQGLPARAAWVDRDQQGQFALRLNRLVAKGELKAPVALGRDHLKCHQMRPTSMLTSTKHEKPAEAHSLALLNRLLSSASAADWASIDARSADEPCESAQAFVADGAPVTETRIGRVLNDDF